MNKKNYQIRHATLDDLDKIADLESRCFSKADGATRENFEDRLKVFPNHFWLLEVNGKLVSMVNGMVTNNSILEDEMYADSSLHDEQGDWQMIFGVETHPDYRRNGYAEILLKHVIKEVEEQKRKGLILTCKEHMVHYYEKFGFVNEGLSESVHGGAEWYHMRCQMRIKFYDYLHVKFENTYDIGNEDNDYVVDVDYTIQRTTKNIDFSQVREILFSHGLSSFDAETQKKVFENSYAVTFLCKNNRVIGVGRAISDGICQAALYNIALDNEYCGKGLGKVIIDDLLTQVKGCNVILYTHPKWAGLYEHWGFKNMLTGFAKYIDEEHFMAEGFI